MKQEKLCETACIHKCLIESLTTKDTAVNVVLLLMDTEQLSSYRHTHTQRNSSSNSRQTHENTDRLSKHTVHKVACAYSTHTNIMERICAAERVDMFQTFVFEVLILRFHRCPKTSESINNEDGMNMYSCRVEK